MAKRKKKNRSQKYRYRYTGRHTKLTEECVKKLEEAFGVGANVKQACYHADISTRTYYNWIEECPDLLHRFEDLRQKLPLQALYNIAGRIHGKSVDGDISISKWLLERRMKDEYGDSLKLEHSDGIGEGTPEEDKEVIEEYHAKLKENRIKRSRAKAIEDGELKV